ncbi:hypothetical protein FQZ97_798390 [compost metagenome]
MLFDADGRYHHFVKDLVIGLQNHIQEVILHFDGLCYKADIGKPEFIAKRSIQCVLAVSIRNGSVPCNQVLYYYTRQGFAVSTFYLTANGHRVSSVNKRCSIGHCRMYQDKEAQCKQAQQLPAS